MNFLRFSRKNVGISGSPIGWNKERYFMQGAGGAGVDEH